MLALPFIFRSQFAIGYIALIGIILTVIIAPSVLFVAAGFMALSATSLGVNADCPQGTSVFVMPVIGAVCGLGLGVFLLVRRQR